MTYSKKKSQNDPDTVSISGMYYKCSFRPISAKKDCTGKYKVTTEIGDPQD